MYAVIETGGKQYRVEVGTELQVELLDAEPGKTITIDRVLLVADGDESTIGRPLVADATVSVEVVSQTRGPKLISFKYRPKARSRVKKGHRQELTVLRVADITLNGKSAAKSAEQAEKQAKTERQRARGGRRRAGRPRRRARRQAGGRDRGAGDDQEAGQGQGRARRERVGQRVDSSEDRGEGRAKPAAKTADQDDDEDHRQARDQGRSAEEAGSQGRRRREGGRSQADPRHEEGRVDPMAHKKAGGSVKNGRDSVGQRLGVKAGDGQLVSAGSIIVRQRGMTFLSGPGTGLGHDYTVFATVTGKVKFEHATKSKKRIRVEAVETAATSA